MRFNNYLAEEVAEVTHLTHLEDLLITKGIDGYYDIKNIITSVLANDESTIMQVKIDGSPAVFFGTDPLDNKFFISTKSLFNKFPKVAKSHSDVDQMFTSPGLSDIMHKAFEHLSKFHINPDVVYQGDVLFTEDTKKETTVDGERYITFRPNVLTYAVSPSLKKFYDNVKTAKFGLVVHTMYKVSKRDETGFSLTTVPYNFRTLVNQSNGDVFITDNIIHGVKVENDAGGITSRLVGLEDEVKKSSNIMAELKRRDVVVPQYIMAFMTTQLHKETAGIFGHAKFGGKFNGDKVFGELVDYCLGAYEKSATQKDVGDYKMLKDRMMKVLIRNKYKIIMILYVYFEILQIKYELMDLLSGNTVFSKVFKGEGDKLSPASDEGIVILAGDNIIKLVDRTEFSKMNMMQHGRIK